MLICFVIFSEITRYCGTVGQLSDVAELGEFQPESDGVFQLTECFLLELHKMHPSSKNCEEKLRQSRCLTPLPE